MTSVEKEHVVYFQTMETKQLLFIRQRVKTHNELPFIRRRGKIHKQLRLVRWKTKNFIWDTEETQIPNAAQWTLKEKKKLFLWMKLGLRGMVSLVKRIPKEKTCPRGKRQ